LSFTLNKVAPAAQANPLRIELEELTSQHSSEDVQYGILIRDLETGKVVYEKDADRLLNPASNAKVLTTLAALALLGPDYRFKTQLLGAGNMRQGRLPVLILRATATPAWTATGSRPWSVR